MKWIFFFVLNYTLLQVQAQTAFDKAACMEPYQLDITTGKTTNLVFPAAITSVDRGSAAVLAQKAKGVENILQVKAATVVFEETNLTVITADGKLYSFLVDYAPSPVYLNINLGVHNAAPENVLQSSCMAASHAKNNGHGLSDKSGRAELTVQGFYIREEHLFCKLRLENRSQIAYDMEQLRFYTRDKKQARRTASQETEVHPDYIYGDTTTLKGKAAAQMVAALPKFTIPDGKYLYVELLERNGGRHFFIKVSNRKLMKARLIL
jgi:Bacteroides conjugative transposon TraN protein